MGFHVSCAFILSEPGFSGLVDLQDYEFGSVKLLFTNVSGRKPTSLGVGGMPVPIFCLTENVKSVIICPSKSEVSCISGHVDYIRVQVTRRR